MKYKEIMEKYKSGEFVVVEMMEGHKKCFVIDYVGNEFVSEIEEMEE